MKEHKFGESGPIWEEHLRRKKKIRKVAFYTAVIAAVLYALHYYT